MLLSAENRSEIERTWRSGSTAASQKPPCDEGRREEETDRERRAGRDRGPERCVREGGREVWRLNDRLVESLIDQRVQEVAYNECQGDDAELLWREEASQDDEHDGRE